MQITLNHTIVHAYDKIKSAEFYKKIFGFDFVKVWGSFAVVRINDSLVFDFVTSKKVSSSHYAFKVSEEDFDLIFERVKKEKLTYGSSPASQEDQKINFNDNGRGVYFKDPNGHVLEIITQDYIID